MALLVQKTHKLLLAGEKKIINVCILDLYRGKTKNNYFFILIAFCACPLYIFF